MDVRHWLHGATGRRHSLGKTLFLFLFVLFFLLIFWTPFVLSSSTPLCRNAECAPWCPVRSGPPRCGCSNEKRPDIIGVRSINRDAKNILHRLLAGKMSQKLSTALTEIHFPSPFMRFTPSLQLLRSSMV